MGYDLKKMAETIRLGNQMWSERVAKKSLNEEILDELFAGYGEVKRVKQNIMSDKPYTWEVFLEPSLVRLHIVKKLEYWDIKRTTVIPGKNMGPNTHKLILRIDEPGMRDRLREFIKRIEKGFSA